MPLDPDRPDALVQVAQALGEMIARTLGAIHVMQATVEYVRDAGTEEGKLVGVPELRIRLAFLAAGWSFKDAARVIDKLVDGGMLRKEGDRLFYVERKRG